MRSPNEEDAHKRRDCAKRFPAIAAPITSALFAAWAVTVYVGVNWISKPEDDTGSKLLNTAVAVTINAALVYEFGLGALNQFYNQIATPKKSCQELTAGSVINFIACMAGSVMASAIFADLGPKLEAPFFASAINYALLLLVNTPMHYLGTDRMFKAIGSTALDTTSDWAIAALPEKCSQSVATAQLRRQITGRVMTAFDKACLAHNAAYHRDSNHLLPVIDLSHCPHEQARSIYTNITAKEHLKHEYASRTLKGGLNISLFAIMMISLAPYFINSYGISPIDMVKFLGTTLATAGLVMIMVGDYSPQLSNSILYRKLPSLLLPKQDKKCDAPYAGRFIAGATIILGCMALSYISATTSDDLYFNNTAPFLINNATIITGDITIRVGTVLFNTYAICSLLLKFINPRLLKNDELFQFRMNSDATRKQFAQCVLDKPAEIAEIFSDVLTDTQKQFLQKNCKATTDSDVSCYIDTRHNSIEAIANTTIYAILPTVLAIGASILLQTQLDPEQQFDFAAIRYIPFLVIHAARLIHSLCSQHRAARRPQQVSLQEELLEHGEGHTETIETNGAPTKTNNCQQVARALKATMFGVGAEYALRLLADNLELPANSTTITDGASTGLGIAAALSTS